jgi:hypothetical protein
MGLWWVVKWAVWMDDLKADLTVGLKVVLMAIQWVD